MVSNLTKADCVHCGFSLTANVKSCPVCGNKRTTICTCPMSLRELGRHSKGCPVPTRRFK